MGFAGCTMVKDRTLGDRDGMGSGFFLRETEVEAELRAGRNPVLTPSTEVRYGSCMVRSDIQTSGEGTTVKTLREGESVKISN